MDIKVLQVTIEEEKLDRACRLLNQLCESAEVNPITQKLAIDIFIRNCSCNAANLRSIPVSVLVYGFLRLFCRQLLLMPDAPMLVKSDANHLLVLLFN